VPSIDFPDLAARERRLRIEHVDYIAENDATGSAVMFTEYSDAEYRVERANTTDLWNEEVGQFYAGDQIYRTDLLPVPSYLRKAIDAYAALGPDMLDHFLDTSFLGDGVTSIRKYIDERGDASFGLDNPDAPPDARTDAGHELLNVFAMDGRTFQLDIIADETIGIFKDRVVARLGLTNVRLELLSADRKLLDSELVAKIVGAALQMIVQPLPSEASKAMALKVLFQSYSSGVQSSVRLHSIKQCSEEDQEVLQLQNELAQSGLETSAFYRVCGLWMEHWCSDGAGIDGITDHEHSALFACSPDGELLTNIHSDVQISQSNRW